MKKIWSESQQRPVVHQPMLGERLRLEVRVHVGDHATLPPKLCAETINRIRPEDGRVEVLAVVRAGIRGDEVVALMTYRRFLALNTIYAMAFACVTDSGIDPSKVLIRAVEHLFYSALDPRDFHYFAFVSPYFGDWQAMHKLGQELMHWPARTNDVTPDIAQIRDQLFEELRLQRVTSSRPWSVAGHYAAPRTDLAWEGAPWGEWWHNQTREEGVPGTGKRSAMLSICRPR